jgi:hypothetical protein
VYNVVHGGNAFFGTGGVGAALDCASAFDIINHTDEEANRSQKKHPHLGPVPEGTLTYTE